MRTEHCKRCGWTWEPKIEGRPAQCPHCHSSYWDKDYSRADLVHKNRHQGVKVEGVGEWL